MAADWGYLSTGRAVDRDQLDRVGRAIAAMPQAPPVVNAVDNDDGGMTLHEQLVGVAGVCVALVTVD